MSGTRQRSHPATSGRPILRALCEGWCIRKANRLCLSRLDHPRKAQVILSSRLPQRPPKTYVILTLIETNEEDPVFLWPALLGGQAQLVEESAIALPCGVQQPLERDDLDVAFKV